MPPHDPQTNRFSMHAEAGPSGFVAQIKRPLTPGPERTRLRMMLVDNPPGEPRDSRPGAQTSSSISFGQQILQVGRITLTADRLRLMPPS